MSQQQFKYIYGPVYSWRLGRSLGIDPIAAQKKLCNFNCVYCQLGETLAQTTKRQIFVPAQSVMDEINQLDPDLKIDYLTFSGRGEPTLAKNLGEMIFLLKQCRSEKIAVITNAGLIGDEQVRQDLISADCVLAKLDACDQRVFAEIDDPDPAARFDQIVEGLKIFRQDFQGRLALQMMFVAGNKSYAPQMAAVALSIGADEVELNTPLRPCGVKPLTERDMKEIKICFDGVPGVTMVYERERKTIDALDRDEAQKRHGNYN